MVILLSDIKYALRQLGKHPGFTVVAMATLALGIGANLALFGILNEMLLKPKPVSRPDELWAAVPADETGQQMGALTYRPFYDAIRRDGRVFNEVIAYAPIRAKLRTDVGSESISAELVAGDYFAMLGVVPVLGRAFLPEEREEGWASSVAVISHAFCRSRFGGSEAALGEIVTLNDTPIEIVGVAPPGFGGLHPFEPPSLWIPANMESVLEDRSTSYYIVGRLTEPKLAATAADVLSPIAAEVTEGLSTGRYPQLNLKGYMPDFTRFRLEPVGRGLLGTSRLKSKIVRFLQFAALATMLLLLIACANVAGLFLARGLQRRKETATHVALGATRLDLMRRALCEGILIAAGGTLCAMLVFSWVSRTMMTFITWWPGAPLRLIPDVRVLLFAVGGVLAVGSCASLLPAMQSSRLDLCTALKDTQGTSRRRLWLRHGLIVAQVAGSLILLCGATLCLRSMSKQLAVDLGYRHDRLAIVPLDLERIGFTTETVEPQLSEIVRRLGLVPGVEDVCVSPYQPLVSGIAVASSISRPPEGYNGPDIEFAMHRRIGAGLFRSMGIPLTRGREFSREDIESDRKVIMINERFSQMVWPGQNPLGRFVGTREVIGVVQDPRLHLHDDWLEGALFGPTRKADLLHAALLIRTSGDARFVLSSVRVELKRMHPRLIAGKLRTLRDVLKADLSFQQTGMRILALLGGLALLLASVGTYGVMAYVVNSRTRDIGVRLAIGATPDDVMRQVLSVGLRLGLVAIVIGVPLAIAAAVVLRHQIPGVSPFDPISFLAMVMGVLAALIAACWLPARRASRVDPMEALRCE